MTRNTKRPQMAFRHSVPALVAALLVSTVSVTFSVAATSGRRAANSSVHGSSFPPGSYQAAGGALVVTFTGDGKFSVKRPNGGPIAAGTYTIDSDQIVLTETHDGEDGNRMCEEPGEYRWKFDGKALSFSKVVDGCEGRVRALTLGPCTILK